MLAISEEISIIASCVFGVSLISTIFLIPVINKIGIRFELIDNNNKTYLSHYTIGESMKIADKYSEKAIN